MEKFIPDQVTMRKPKINPGARKWILLSYGYQTLHIYQQARVCCKGMFLKNIPLTNLNRKYYSLHEPHNCSNQSLCSTRLTRGTDWSQKTFYFLRCFAFPFSSFFELNNKYFFFHRITPILEYTVVGVCSHLNFWLIRNCFSSRIWLEQKIRGNSNVFLYLSTFLKFAGTYMSDLCWSLEVEISYSDLYF